MTSSTTETIRTEVRAPVLKLSAGRRLFMVAAGYIPFMNVVGLFAPSVERRLADVGRPYRLCHTRNKATLLG